MYGGILSKKVLFFAVGTLVLSGLLILGAYLSNFLNIGKSTGKSDQNQTQTTINSASGQTISLPFNIKSSSIKNPTILYRLSGHVVSIEPNPQASSSTWVIQPENPSDPEETLTIPWSRPITYQANVPTQQATIQDVKEGSLVEVLISFNLQNNQKTVGQVLVKNP